MRRSGILLAGMVAITAGGGLADAQSPPGWQQLCVTIEGAPSPSDGWTPDGLATAIANGDVAVVGVTAAASCGVPPSPGPSPSGPVAPTAEWGPMAVVHDPAVEGFDAGNGPARLVIGADCVVFKGSRGPGETLVWRDGQSEWIARTGRIRFRNLDGTWLVLRDGDRLMLGGYDPTDVGGIPDPPLAPWVVRPNPGCPSRQMLVTEVSRAD